MTPATKFLLALAALSLAACANPRAGGEGDPWGQGGFGMGGGIASTPLGDPNNPNSIAHFNERIGDTVYFATDRWELSPEAQATLRAQAGWLIRNPQYLVLIEGHADERGTREYNIALGERRAEAVRAFLVGEGVAAQRIRTVSYGKERPVEACPEPRCWDKNRRAVTVVSR